MDSAVTQLKEMLRGGRPREVLRGEDVPSTANIQALAREYGWVVREVAMEGVRAKVGFIDAWATSLGFPGWHGRNWDAFEELLGDLSWLPESNGCIIVVHGMEGFAEAEPEEARTALEIIGSAVERAALMVAIR